MLASASSAAVAMSSSHINTCDSQPPAMHPHSRNVALLTNLGDKGKTHKML